MLSLCEEENLYACAYIDIEPFLIAVAFIVFALLIIFVLNRAHHALHLILKEFKDLMLFKWGVGSANALYLLISFVLFVLLLIPSKVYKLLSKAFSEGSGDTPYFDEYTFIAVFVLMLIFGSFSICAVAFAERRGKPTR